MAAPIPACLLSLLSADDVRVYVVVDTNVLMSHLAFVERVFDTFTGAALEARWVALVMVGGSLCRASDRFGLLFG